MIFKKHFIDNYMYLIRKHRYFICIDQDNEEKVKFTWSMHAEHSIP